MVALGVLVVRISRLVDAQMRKLNYLECMLKSKQLGQAQPPSPDLGSQIMSLASIGNVILSRRVAVGLSRETLAGKAHLSPERLRQVECGEAEDFDTVELLEIAMALDLNASTIIEEAELAVHENGHCVDSPIVHGFIAH
jgi:hypothetical protein